MLFRCAFEFDQMLIINFGIINLALIFGKMSGNKLTNLLTAMDTLVDNYLHPTEWFGTLPLPSMISSESIDLFDF